MEDVKSAEILKSLAAGHAPADAAVLQSPDVVRALFLGAESLEGRARTAHRNGNLPRNAGKAWTPEEDQRPNSRGNKDARIARETGLALVRPLVALVVIFCAIGVSGYAVYLRQKESLKQSIQNQMLAVAELKAAQVEFWLDERRTDARLAATGPMMAQDVERWQATGIVAVPQKRRVAKRLERIRQSGPYENVLVLGENGSLLASAKEAEGRVDALSKELASQAMRDRAPLFSPLYRSENRPDKPIFLNLLAPLIAEDEHGSRIVGAMLFRIDPHRFLFPLIQSWPTSSPTAETLLITREGEQVRPPAPARALRDRGPVRGVSDPDPDRPVRGVNRSGGEGYTRRPEGPWRNRWKDSFKRAGCASPSS